MRNVGVLGFLSLVFACAGPGRPAPSDPGASSAVAGPDPSVGPRPGDRLARRGDEIVACGQLFHTGTPVVLWMDPGGFDAYRPHRRSAPDEVAPEHGEGAARYGTFRRGLPPDVDARVRAGGWRLADLQRVVRQVVLHYDAAGTSARCFRVLHDLRGLSAHFLVDLDGTVYQTLDVKERAWHAGTANDVSVGIEIANVGAYADPETPRRWYATGARGTQVALPPGIERGRLPVDFAARPARPEIVRGAVHGRTLWQYDYTPEQYAALGHLLATLTRVLPAVRPDAPRGPDGAVLARALPDAKAAAFAGIVGHYHLTEAKADPGPAFDWSRVFDEMKRAR